MAFDIPRRYIDINDNYKNASVYINDSNTEEYFVVRDLEETITLGKSSFIIDISNPELFVVGSNISIEISNDNGDTLYTDIPNYVEDNRRRVSISVYPENDNGNYTIAILGRLKNVPKEWKDRPNILLTKQIIVDKSKSNNQTIRFYNIPSVTITENQSKKQGVISYKDNASKIITTSGSGNFSGYYGDDSKYYLTFNNDSMIREMKNASIIISSSISGAINRDYIISRVLSNSTAQLNQPYYTKTNNKIKISGFQSSGDISYTMSYASSVSQSAATGSSQSFANIELTNIGIFSGQISRIKTYIKNSQVSDEIEYELINDTAIKSKDLLIDSESIYNNHIGYFYNKEWFESWWATSSAETNWSYEMSSNYHIDSIHISCSENPISLSNEIKIINESKSLSYTYNESEVNVYSLEFSGYSIQKNKEYFDGEKINELNRAKLKIYLSGSAFGNSDGHSLGKCIWENKNGNIGTTDYDNYLIPFEADNTGQGQVVLLIESGEWYISNLQINFNQIKGFSPTSYRYMTPIPEWINQANCNFKFEFYNNSNVIAPFELYKYNVDIEGPAIGSGILSTANLVQATLPTASITTSIVGYDIKVDLTIPAADEENVIYYELWNRQTETDDWYLLNKIQNNSSISGGVELSYYDSNFEKINESSSYYIRSIGVIDYVDSATSSILTAITLPDITFVSEPKQIYKGYELIFEVPENRLIGSVDIRKCSSSVDTGTAFDYVSSSLVDNASISIGSVNTYNYLVEDTDLSLYHKFWIDSIGR